MPRKSIPPQFPTQASPQSTSSPPAERPEPNEIFRLLARAVEEHLHDKGVDEASIREIVSEEIGKVTLPKSVEFRLPTGAINTLAELPHRQFTDLVGLVEEGHTNLLLVGPSGSGKTTLAKNLAQALGRYFGFISLSAGITETHLLGRTLPQADGSWKFVPSLFVQMYESGGVYLLDEIDAADANVMVAINAALANGVLVTPDGIVHRRHENCIIIAAANTWGRGGDLMYVGRNQLDASTLDRFCLSTLFVTYDEGLETELVKSGLDGEVGDTLLQWVQQVRGAISRNRIRRVASTRLVVSSIKALRHGRSFDDVKARFFQDWSDDEKAKVC
ncbi:MAG: AAA family ATPase [Phycisphaerales bacterium]|nr:AAA family ATPase [Phycisphaerales bacterium]